MLAHAGLVLSISPSTVRHATAYLEVIGHMFYIMVLDRDLILFRSWRRWKMRVGT